MTSRTNEHTFQNNIIKQLVNNGWLEGKSADYNRELALYPEDVLGFVKDTQDEQWQKFCALNPNDTDNKFLQRIGTQLNKVDPNAADRQMRTFGTLGVLRHKVRDRGTRFRICQFKPEHDLNPDTLSRYSKNRLRVLPELVYSP
jgi:type I restriction enzyme R subunit